ASQQLHPSKAHLCRVGRKQRGHHADIRSSRHSELCHRIRRGPRIHASRALSGGAGGVDGDAAERGAGFQAGRRRRPRRGRARGRLESEVRRGDTWLDPIESTRLLAAYSIPIAPALLARNGDEAAAAARPFLAEGSGVVAKILSPDIVHKSEVGGVRLNLTSE